MKYLNLFLAIAIVSSCQMQNKGDDFKTTVGHQVIGTDTRVDNTFKNIPETKYTQYIKIHFKSDLKEIYDCSGTYIGNNLIVTAAHCVYDEKTKEFAFIMKSAIGSDKNFLKIEKVYYRKAYIDEPYTKNDLAILKIAQNNSLKLKKLEKGASLEALDDYSEPFITISGFPIDKPIHSLWSSSCQGISLEDGLVYDCDTIVGMSGSGLMTKNDNSEFVLVGVHSGAYGNLYNYGHTFSKKTIEEINLIKEKGVKETESFASYNLASLNVEEISVVNNCDEPIKVAAKYIDEREDWINPVFVNLKPNEKSNYIITAGKDYFIYALTLDDGEILAGKYPFLLPAPSMERGRYKRFYSSGKFGNRKELNVCDI